jgi:hypothetical protein
MKILKEIDFSFPSISIGSISIIDIKKNLSLKLFHAIYPKKKKLYIRPCQLFNVSLLELFDDFLFFYFCWIPSHVIPYMPINRFNVFIHV